METRLKTTIWSEAVKAFKELKAQFNSGLITVKEFTFQSGNIGMLNYAIDYLDEIHFYTGHIGS